MVINNKSKKVYKETTKQTVDFTTGEITHEILEEEAYVGAEPNFIKLYLENLSVLNQASKGSNNVLRELLKLMTYDNLIILNPYIKKKIAKDLNIGVSSLANALTNLKNAQIIEHLGVSTYRANPYLFGKGKWEDIKKIRLTVTFEEGKITQSSQFEFDEKDNQNNDL